MGPQLGLRGGIKAQYFAFIAKQFPFYGYRGAIWPVGAALKPSILLFLPSIFHFTAMGPQ